MAGGMPVTTGIAHACLGLEALGECSYNPAAPSIYFGIGAAVAALGFVLAVQQLLKPIYIFRLEARGLNLKWLHALIFGGLLCVVLAALLPHLPILHTSPLGYPILWEVIAALLFATAYAAVALAIVQPVRLRASRIIPFVRSSAWLLSSATERDHRDFAQDLERNLPMLITAARFSDANDQASAFFVFAHRTELARADYARSFLGIIADPAFCGTLVRGTPWLVSEMLREIAAMRLYSRSAEDFLHQLGCQAILRDDSMIARELSYHGFGTVPLLSNSLFARSFILNFYDPFNSFRFLTGERITPAMLSRFNGAAEKALTTIIEAGSVWHDQVSYSIGSFYKSVSMNAWSARTNNKLDDFPVLEMHDFVALAIKMAEKLFDNLEPDQVQGFYVVNPEIYRHDFLESLVDIVFDALCFISNGFMGVNDPFWFIAIEAFHRTFPPFGDQPNGMTPFQQRLGLKMLSKLQDNMRGFYPSISRVLLACIGPYDRGVEAKNRTAFTILKEAVYHELQGLPELAEKKSDKVTDYLPDNIVYDPSTKELTHTYSSGQQSITNLASLSIKPVSLLAADVHP